MVFCEDQRGSSQRQIARLLGRAASTICRELVRWIDQETGMGQEAACMLLTMAGKARLGNMVDPKDTVGTGIAKKYIGL